MSYKKNNIRKIYLLLLLCAIFGTESNYGQEAAVTEINSKSTYHNQLFFNRFLINPTFSLVRENKSYINILHRNQYATFEDNNQNYFLGFSNRINDRTALGISVYSQWSGVVQEFGFNVNYATAVKLGEESKLTFGTNITYYTEGLDQNRVVVADTDNKISDAKKESKVAVQPGVTLSLGGFDFGLYATELFKYNQTTNEFLTNLSTKSVKASVQYTHQFMANRGLFAHARLMPMVQVGKNKEGGLGYVGSILLDLPDYGWFQTNFDDDYGLSLGLGFNLSKRMSLGYLLEKDLMTDDADLGWNHEVSLAYTFDNHGSSMDAFADSSEDAKVDRIVRNYEEQILRLTAENQKSLANNSTRGEREVQKSFSPEMEGDINSMAYENRLILDELIIRQDSIDAARDAAFEKQLKSLVDVLKKEIKESLNNDVEEKPRTPVNTANTALASNVKKTRYNPNDGTKIEEPKRFNSLDSYVAMKENMSTASADAKESLQEKTIEQVAETEAQPIVAKEESTEQIKDYVKLPIKILNQSDIVGVKAGYYVIANVYKNEKYLNAFMETLKQQGLDARQFYNKENGLHYVYLADYNFKEEAQMAYVSNLNGKYQDEKWIMQVDDHSAIVNNIYED
ncbi:PorP/SprF family type IX secretion system membrane protein [Zobellia galactanivorans]|uniref:PorP/SprF family type IX secretion system membrane protein n=1 Tax=Zobellia galactanivorans (strain DSM 12802 / CCUG 47099 / CIP 106680 / NCIMB 13871 / Dsij) TaxID=63186 RepID=UPI001C072331|nr:PorP/SprF family type IX secretion system membrane protein [Zobellia galactanivorans]MBU3025682.1 PorP/SprF family type IX secretion system membrane protein [Zobellia galactanivorans]